MKQGLGPWRSHRLLLARVISKETKVTGVQHPMEHHKDTPLLQTSIIRLCHLWHMLQWRHPSNPTPNRMVAVLCHRKKHYELTNSMLIM